MRKPVTHSNLFAEWLYSTDEERKAIETTAQTLYELHYWGFFEYSKFLYYIRNYLKCRNQG